MDEKNLKLKLYKRNLTINYEFSAFKTLKLLPNDCTRQTCNYRYDILKVCDVM